MTNAAEANGIYVYCITEGGPLGLAPDTHPLRRVRAISRGGLAAVVSDVPMDEFGTDGLLRHLEDAGWLEREARAHERVIERVMAQRTVLPMRFCTVFRTEDGVVELLDANREKFRRALTRLRGREEWQMKMLWEPAPPVALQAGRPPAQPSGGAYLRRKAAARLAAQALSAEAQRQAQRAFEMLRHCAEQIQLKPVAPSSSPTAPRLILNAVCLLMRPHVPALREQLESLGSELADKGIRLELIGPWPPYHFSEQAHDHVGLP